MQVTVGTTPVIGGRIPLLVGHMGLSHNTLHQHSVGYISVKSLISLQIHFVTLVHHGIITIKPIVFPKTQSNHYISMLSPLPLLYIIPIVDGSIQCCFLLSRYLWLKYPFQIQFADYKILKPIMFLLDPHETWL